MNTVANTSARERAELFRETGARMGLSAALVEKDFWVCWTLGHLFDIAAVRDMLMFKGGTSLSKVFGLINRFSEDIDLAISYAPLGFVDDRDPIMDMSRSRRTRLLDTMMTTCREYIAGPFLEALHGRWTEAIRSADSWALVVSEDDPNTIEFMYPSAGVGTVEYVRPRILLELGTHAALVPSGAYTITPFAAEEFPGVFAQSSCAVKAIKAERTFWEKATILHVEHHRAPDSPLPGNYARHYYDMFMLARSAVRDSAVRDVELLRKVVEHKTKFYYSAWARYDLAIPSTLALVPPEARRRDLQRDYDAMSVMIFGEPPSLNDVLDELAQLEAGIHAS